MFILVARVDHITAVLDARKQLSDLICRRLPIVVETDNDIAALRRPAISAACCPKFLARLTPVILLYLTHSTLMTSNVSSGEQSFTRMIS